MNGSADGFRVGIDGFNLALPKGTGVATYARTLSYALQGAGHPVDVLYGMNISHKTSAALREIIFFDSLDQEHSARRGKVLSPRWFKSLASEFSNRHAVTVPLSGRVEQRGFVSRMPAYDRILNVPWLFQRAHRHFRRTNRFLTVSVPDAPRIMHWTYPLPIKLRGARNIYTIHDLVPLRFPNTTLDDKSVHFRLIKTLCAQADGICTVSEASARDIVSFFPAAASRLHNTYQSFQPNEQALAQSEEDCAKEIEGSFGLRPGSFFLFFGSLEPKKNIGRIIEAFLAAKTDRRLVLVGAMAWKNESELRFLKHGIASGRILSIEYLPQTNLYALIRLARGVVFPSITEGFGLPVLEAMAMGTPVITSREASLPEVAGDAALYADAYDVTSILDAIETLDRDDALARDLASRGPGQAALFSMARYQERLKTMYRNLLAAPPRS